MADNNTEKAEEERYRQEFIFKQLGRRHADSKDVLMLNEELQLWRDYYQGCLDNSRLEMFLSRCNNIMQQLSAWFLLAENYEMHGYKEKANNYWKKLLEFSPENKFVSEALKYGESTYKDKYVRIRGYKDFFLMGFLIVICIFLIKILFLQI